MDIAAIKENLDAVRKNIALASEKSAQKREVKLIAVTKTHSPEMINAAIDCGVTDIGENKVQEILDKYDSVKPVNWHLIGHLQTNKVKYIIDKVCLIHSVDSKKLLDEINTRAEKIGKVMSVLIQVNISGEESKFGISPDGLDEMLEYASTRKNVFVKGLMTILPKFDDEVTLRLHFNNINRKFIDIDTDKYDNVSMDYLSMGMSGDYVLAVEEGSNMVRVGSAIFGEREYRI